MPVFKNVRRLSKAKLLDLAQTLNAGLYVSQSEKMTDGHANRRVVAALLIAVQ
jgi:hypothetical protein